MNEKKRIAFVKLYPDITGEHYTLHASLKKWIEKNDTCEDPSYITFQNETIKYNPLWSKHKFIYLDIEDEQDLLSKGNDINDRFDLIIFESDQRMFDSGYNTSILRFLNQLSVPIVSILKNSYNTSTILDSKLMNTIVDNSRMVYTLSQSTYHKLYKTYPEFSDKIIQGYEWVEGKSDYTQEEMKRFFGLKEKRIMISVGEMKPSSKFEKLISQLKEFLVKHEDFMMIIVGNSDASDTAEYYHKYLEHFVADHDLKDKIWIIDQDTEQSSLLDFMEMSDIYISAINNLNIEYDPYLAMALHHRNLVLAPPYSYAIELLKNQRGILFDFEHNSHVRETLEYILEDRYLVDACIERGHEFISKDKSKPLDMLTEIMTSNCLDLNAIRLAKVNKEIVKRKYFEEDRYMEV